MHLQVNSERVVVRHDELGGERTHAMSTKFHTPSREHHLSQPPFVVSSIFLLHESHCCFRDDPFRKWTEEGEMNRTAYKNTHLPSGASESSRVDPSSDGPSASRSDR